MTLIERIAAALTNNKLDPAKFERAACALLQDKYPWLVPVESGTDFGRDGDIYRAIPGDPLSIGRLLATTGDPLRNLRSSHTSWPKNELRVDALVIACSQPITATTRKKLEDYCQKNRLPLPHCYGRDWLAETLRTNSDWRKELLRIAARLEAISPNPPGYTDEQPSFTGREDSLHQLRSAIDESSDVILAGTAGVGKTRLLSEVGNISFVEPLAKDHLADDLMGLSPRCAVVDDAHLHGDLLQELSRLREQEGLSFVIVATTWPDLTSEMAETLPTAATITLDLLPRDEMDRIVQAYGVTGVRSRHLILEQAEGRPGWARILCNALMSEDGEHVASGATLIDHVERYLHGATDSATTMDAIACVAALGGATHEDLTRIGTLVEVPLASLMAAIHSVATQGLLEQRYGNWYLPLPLRSPLVSRWFFGPRKTRSWDTLVEAFPERTRNLTEALLHAAAVVPVDELTSRARAWAGTLPIADQAEAWDEPTLSLVRDYALVDEAAATFATHTARGALLYDPVVETQPGAATSTGWR
jgi:hypothetical protein